MISTKNFGASPAGVDLGLTPAVSTPQEDEEAKRKRLLEQQKQGMNSPSTQLLFGEGI